MMTMLPIPWLTAGTQEREAEKIASNWKKRPLDAVCAGCITGSIPI